MLYDSVPSSLEPVVTFLLFQLADFGVANGDGHASVMQTATEGTEKGTNETKPTDGEYQISYLNTYNI